MHHALRISNKTLLLIEYLRRSMCEKAWMWRKVIFSFFKIKHCSLTFYSKVKRTSFQCNICWKNVLRWTFCDILRSSKLISICRNSQSVNLSALLVTHSCLWIWVNSVSFHGSSPEQCCFEATHDVNRKRVQKCQLYNPSFGGDNSFSAIDDSKVTLDRNLWPVTSVSIWLLWSCLLSGFQNLAVSLCP